MCDSTPVDDASGQSAGELDSDAQLRTPAADELDSDAPRWTQVACALCQADTPRPIFVDRVYRRERRHDFNIVRCGECGFIYVTPRGSGRVFSNLAGGAARRDAAVANAPIYDRGLASLHDAGLPDKARILDLGCARGDFLSYATQRGFRPMGVDLNPKLAAAARARGFEVQTGDLRTLSLPYEFDAVTLWDVIEHVDDPVAVLAACRRALKPQGLLFFHTGNARFQVPKARLRALLQPGAGPFLIPYQHVSHFDAETAAACLARAGLEPVSVGFAGTLHYPDRAKRTAMQLINTLASIPARLGGPLLTNALGAIGRRVD